ncbi:MAG: hypothetical protein R2800_01170 [Flavipsychrobacter sp.]
MKKNLAIMLVLVAGILVSQCQNSTPKEEEEEEVATGMIVPVPLSSNGINNFNYPEDSTLINKWIMEQDDKAIAQHGWGIWTALNKETAQSYQKQKLRVFETWLTPADMQALIRATDKGEKMLMEEVKQHRGKLSKPNQFLHATTALAKAGVKPNYDSSRILGFVKYDPTAAKFTVTNQLLKKSVLQGMLDRGMTDIPDFPNTGMTLKPVFEIITQEELNKNDGYFKLNVWSGPPATPRESPEGTWPDYVYIDPNNKGEGNGGVDNGGGRTPKNTYNLTDYVHFKLDAATAEDLKMSLGVSAEEGDIAVLVAMHVTSKEIKRWTWQTFWWTPDAVNPPAPSSAMIAAQMPTQLNGAPAHYAMAQAYTFINPDQPFTGGNNIGTSIYAYNPYLEAGFGPHVLSDPATVITNGKKVVNNYGVLTNCMSCHAHANYAPATVKNAPNYLGDTYVDMEGANFKNTLKVDFAWSIPGNLMND